MQLPDWVPGGDAAVGGALGGLVRWLTLREDWRSGLASVVVGAILAVYCGELAVPVLEPFLGQIVVDPARLSGLGGFIMGIGGIAASGFLIDIWNKRRQGIKGDKP